MDHDVVIVGGGLVGCATAYYLAKAGLRPLVVERGELNGEASGANAGSLHFQLEPRLIGHGEALTGQFSAVIPLNRLAIDLWRGLERELDLDLEVVMDGGVMTAETAADIERLEQKAALEERWGMRTELLSGERLRAQAPYLSRDVKAASFSPDEGHANPRFVTLGYARRAAENGARFETGAEVRGISRESDRWRLAVERQRASGANRRDEHRAPVLVNAAGAWMQAIGRMSNVHLPMFPIAIQMNVTERAAARLPHLVQHIGKALSLKQVRDGNFLIGGGWPARFAKRDGRMNSALKPQPIPSNIAANLRVAVGLMPELRRLHLLRTWAGIVGITADQLPLLGAVAELPDYYVAGGGSGFTLGPVYAKVTAELIGGGGTEHPVDLYSPDRFRHLNMFMGL